MRKSNTAFALAALLSFAFAPSLLSHCEIPCGIYSDTARIHMLYEDITTVEKSMKEIVRLMDEEKGNGNQIVRWIMNKEEHANKIQHIVTQYFMTQRIKPKDSGDAERKYVKQLTLLHNMLIQAMKTKQTTELDHCANLRKLVKDFSAAYFGPEDLKHLKEHHP